MQVSGTAYSLHLKSGDYIAQSFNNLCQYLQKGITECSNSKPWGMVCYVLGWTGLLYGACPSFTPTSRSSALIKPTQYSNTLSYAFLFFILLQTSISYASLTAGPALDLCLNIENGVTQCCSIHNTTSITCCLTDSVLELRACGDIKQELWTNLAIDNKKNTDDELENSWCANFNSDELILDLPQPVLDKRRFKVFRAERKLINYFFQSEQLQKIIARYATIFNLDPPRLCGIRTDLINAYADRENNILCLSEGLIKEKNCAVLVGIIGHEMGHLNFVHNKNYDKYEVEWYKILDKESASYFNHETIADINAVLACGSSQGIIEGIYLKYDTVDEQFSELCLVRGIHNHPHAFLCRIPYVKRLIEQYIKLQRSLKLELDQLKNHALAPACKIVYSG